MSELTEWLDAQEQDIERIREEAAEWQTELGKSSRDWRNALLREANGLKNQFEKEIQQEFQTDIKQWVKEMKKTRDESKKEILDAIKQMRGETDGDSRTSGKSTGAEDILGSADGEGDQAEADDASGRKGRRRSSGTK